MNRRPLNCWRIAPARWTAALGLMFFADGSLASVAGEPSVMSVSDSASSGQSLDIADALGVEFGAEVQPAVFDEESESGIEQAEDVGAEEYADESAESVSPSEDEGAAAEAPAEMTEEFEGDANEPVEVPADESALESDELEVSQLTPEGAAAPSPLTDAEEVAPVETVDRRYFRPIGQVTANATLPEGLLPDQAPIEDKNLAEPATPEFVDLRFDGGWAVNNYRWSATRFCHGPLYFEEINLERYGYGCNPVVQPFLSGAHFFLTIPALPYKMAVHPPNECIYTLGHYRPGDRVPYRWSRYPLDARAAAVEASVVVGLVFLIP